MLWNSFGHMGWGGGSFGFGWMFTLLFWGLVIWAILALVRGGKGGACCGQGQDKPELGRKTPLDILNERYAKGEIDKTEFETKKKDLAL